MYAVVILNNLWPEYVLIPRYRYFLLRVSPNIILAETAIILPSIKVQIKKNINKYNEGQYRFAIVVNCWIVIGAPPILNHHPGSCLL